jgi:hypothetical protein
MKGWIYHYEKAEKILEDLERTEPYGDASWYAVRARQANVHALLAQIMHSGYEIFQTATEEK